MKPIEPGCLALVIRGLADDLGKTVTVGRLIGRHPSNPPHSKALDWWEVSQPLRVIDYTQSDELVWSTLYREIGLMRIDGEVEDEEVEAEAVAVR